MKSGHKTKAVDFDQHIENEYGKPSMPSRDHFEEGFEAFKLGNMIQEMRKEHGLT